MDSMCRKCGSTGFYIQQRGMQVGMYCDTCGSWMKWVGKKELPFLKRKGYAILPQNVEVTLKGSADLGLEKVDKLPDIPNGDLGITSFGGPKVSVEPIVNPSTAPTMPFADMEAEIERRVAERLKVIEEQKKSVIEEVTVDEGYCPICEGNPLTADGHSTVEVTIYSGLMTVTDPDGLNIFGLYKLKRCPFCGKLF